MVRCFEEVSILLIFMNCVVHPSIPSLVILILKVLTMHLRIPPFHRQRFLLQSEDRLEREPKDRQYDAEDNTPLVKSLNRQPMPILPNNVRRLRRLFHLDLMRQKLLVFSVILQLDSFIVPNSSIEALFTLESQENGARSLHLIKEILVGTKLFNYVPVQLIDLRIGLLLDCDAPFEE